MSVEGAAGHRPWSIGARGAKADIDVISQDIDQGVESAVWQARWFAIGIIVAAVLLGPFAPVVWALVIINFFRCHDERDARVLFLKQTAVTLVVIPTCVFAFFLVGETMTDPGGVKGVVLIFAWTLPAAVVAAATWTWPRSGAYVVLVLMLGVLLMDLCYAIDAGRWRAFEDNHGPVVAVANFVIVAIAGFLGWRRPGIGGSMMLTASIVAIMLAGFVDELIPTAFAATVVGLVPGALLMAAAVLGRQQSFPTIASGGA